MAEEEIEVPVAFCKTCDAEVPVFIGKFDFNMPDAPKALRGTKFEAVICPVCEKLLNADGEINVVYYSLEDLQNVTGFTGEVTE